MRKLIATVLLCTAGCGDLTTLPEQDLSARPATSPAPPAPLADPPVEEGFLRTTVEPSCPSARSGCLPPTAAMRQQTPEEVQARHRQTRADAARRNAQIEALNRTRTIRDRPDLARPGERQQLVRDRIRLEQEGLRAQRDRLRNAPYGRTIGNIGY